MNFLALCQMVARESGTISGTLPTSVVNQTGRLAKIVGWTASAWQKIQTDRNAWLWMRQEFTGDTIAGTTRYTPAAWNIDDLARWIIDQVDAGEYPVSLYLTATGVADEGVITYLPWPEWKARYGRGAQDANRPTHYTVTPANELALGPVPNDVYTVRGEYMQLPQTLSANDDVPNLPAQYHEAIAYRALMLLAGHDEAPTTYAEAKSNYDRLMAEVERDFLPQWSIGGGPLA
jgi:hypothetical protein